MKRFVLLCVVSLLLLPACREQSKEEILQQGMEFNKAGNLTAAITLFKNALDKDPNYIDARLALGNAYFELDKLDFAEKELDKVRRQDPKNFEISLRLAQIYQKTNRLDKSLLELRNLEASHPSDAAVLAALAESYALSGDFALSEEKYRKALSSKPSYLNARIGLAKVLFATKQSVAGMQLLQTIIAENPDNPEPLHLQFQIAIRNADRDSAIAVLKKIQQISAEDMTVSYLLGLMLLDSGDIDAARKIASSIKNSRLDHPLVFRLEGLASYLEGKYVQALGELQKSTANMSDLMGFYMIGLTYYQLAQFEQAISSFQKAIDISPEHNQSRLMLAQTFLKQGRLDECIRSIDLILRNNPNNAMAHNLLGSIYLMQGKYDQAMTQLDMAIQIDPGLAQAHVNKGLFNLVAGNLKHGETDLLKAVDAAPELLNYRLLLARYYLRVKNYPLAIKILEEGIKVSSEKAVIYNYLAAVCFAQKNYADAVANLQKAKTIKPDYLAPYFNLANYHVSRLEYPLAISEYQLALKTVPKHPVVLIRIASVYELAGDRIQAESYFQQASATGEPNGCLAHAAFLLRSGQKTRSIETLKVGFAAHPENLTLTKALGSALQADGQFDEAIKLYSHMEEISPKSGVPLLVGVYLQQGKFSLANDLANQAIAGKPSEEYGYLLQSAIYEYRKEWMQAETIIKRGIINCNKGLNLKMRLAGIYAAQGNSTRANQVYDEILLEQPEYVPAIVAKGSSYHAQGNPAKAQELYKAALALDENYALALNNLAYLLIDVRANYKDALPLAIKAFRVMPEDPRIIDTLGYALLKNGQIKQAIAFLEKAARLRPDDQEIQLHLTLAKEAGAKGTTIKANASSSL